MGIICKYDAHCLVSHSGWQLSLVRWILILKPSLDLCVKRIFVYFKQIRLILS